MAIWQFDFFLLPRVPFEARFGEAKIDLPRESVLDDVDHWPDDEVAQAVLADLAQVLPGMPGYWAAGYGKAWGDHDSNIIEVGLDAEHLQDIFVRVDIRRNHKDFVQAVIYLASRHDLLLFTEDDEALLPNEEAFFDVLYRSRAMRYVSDPHG